MHLLRALRIARQHDQGVCARGERRAGQVRHHGGALRGGRLRRARGGARDAGGVVDALDGDGAKGGLHGRRQRRADHGAHVALLRGAAREDERHGRADAVVDAVGDGGALCAFLAGVVSEGVSQWWSGEGGLLAAAGSAEVVAARPARTARSARSSMADVASILQKGATRW
jgi:hypothetical protein